MNANVNHIVNLLIYMLIMTAVYSFLLMIGGKNLFKKAGKTEEKALIPIINVFTALEIADISTFLGILLFVPAVNMIVFIILFYKLGVVFNKNKFYCLVLAILPFIFYPILAQGKSKYKANEEYEKLMDNAKAENSSLLMTEEELKSQVFDEEIEPIVDSIFKNNVQLIENDGSRYKAVKINNDIYERLDVNRAEEIEVLDFGDKTNVDSKNKEEIEFLDL